MDKSEINDEEIENINEQPAPLEEETTEEQPGGEDHAVAKLSEELEGAKDKYIRLYSEFENFRKRTAREKLEMVQFANEKLIGSLLPVVDDFERAEIAIQDKSSSDIQGLFLIQAKLKKVLELYSVKAMDAAQGSEFDSDFHEAVSQVPAPTPELKGKIIEVIEKGYMLNDKVIRYAKVVVGN